MNAPMPKNAPKSARSLSDKALARLDKMRRKTRRVIFIEKFWHYIRWSIFLIFFWLIGGIFHVPQYFSDLIRTFIESAIFIYFILSISYAFKKMPEITIGEIDKRLEADSGLPFHPLTTLGDKPALIKNNIDANILHRHLWEKHCERVAKSLKTLRISPPHLFPTRKAKTALFIFTLVSVGALLQNQTTLKTRFTSALLPWTDDDQTALPHLQAWIDRPNYAAGAPVFLHLNAPSPKDILPEGATLHILLTDSASKPTLYGVQHTRIEQLSTESWQITAPLQYDTTLILHTRGRDIGRWRLNILKDTPPKITWNGKIHHDDSSDTLIPWKAEQVFGLKKVSLILTSPYKDHDKDHDNKEENFEFPLSFKEDATKIVENSPLPLSSHPLAGLKIQARLKAESLSGKISYSDIKNFHIIPHPFHHALSRSLIILRQRSALSLASSQEIEHALILLTQTTHSDVIRLPLLTLARVFAKPSLNHHDAESQLWYLALYDEDLETYDINTANIMAEIRSIAENITMLLSDTKKKDALNNDIELHKKLTLLKEALHKRLDLTFQQAKNTALILPDITGQSSPWNGIAKQIEQDNQNHHEQDALKHLRDMVNMAEQMRSVTRTDLEQVSQQMSQQKEMMNEKAALRHLIKEETNLLNHSALRFYNETKKKNDDSYSDNSEDISQMSTADLLKQLGMHVPQNSQFTEQHATKTDKDADPALVLSQGDARQSDFYLQNGLKTLDDILYQRGNEKLHYQNKALLQAKNDMENALKALAHQKDHEANLLEQKILKDLASALNSMKQKQKQDESKKTKKLSLMMPPHPSSKSQGDHSESSGSNSEDNEGQSMQGQSSDPDQDLDKDSDYQDSENETNGDKKNKKAHEDPLGRPADLNDGDHHIPEKNQNDQRHKIEEELRRRASDQTRSQKELNYLNRLLTPFKQ